MRRITLALILAAAVGCADRSLPPPRVAAPVLGDGSGPPLHNVDPHKPLPKPEEEAKLPPPPFEDSPLLTQRAPEQAAFVDAYGRVGRPRIAITVNNAHDDQFARSVDYQAMKTTLSDWIASNGQVTIVSPDAAQSDRNQRRSNADVLISIDAQATEQYRDGPRVRLIAEAVNTGDGVSIARAFLDVPLPLEKPQINRHTRWLARKLMDDMTNAWLQPAPQAIRDEAAPSSPPSTAPTH